MSTNSPESLKTSQPLTQSFEWQIVKKVGPKPSENLSAFLLLAKYPDGTSQGYELLVPDLRPLEGVLQDPNLWKTFLSSVFEFSGVRQVGD
jgi:hypothetical protein